ncbi:hypothetical protein BaRGS_00010829 [Batillaria attramentaria]|uniref:G-protein coupled receptors family 1 profile domain-containing protein n=1 Tax=Batillaria attramentaria TaxID=370345 RepID=A0ABD0LFQ9_9CAEN
MVVELVSVTLTFMLILALDRVFSLVAALRYETAVTEKRLWIVSSLIWLINLLFPVLGLWNVDMTMEYCIYQVMMPRSTFFLYGTFSLIEIGVTVGLNMFLMIKTFGHIKQIGQTVVGQGKEERIAAMNKKAMVTSLIVTLPFLLLNTPLFILFLVFAVHHSLTETLTGLIAISVCLGLIVTNSLINPFIYVWRSVEVRNEVRRVMFCGKCANPNRTSFSS